MFQISPDQAQWFHLHRVKKVSPVTFVLFACEEVKLEDGPARLFDLRILSNDENIMGNSWCLRSNGPDPKTHTRADCVKFLELYAKFSIANARNRGFDEIEFVDSSREELAMAAALDPVFKRNLEAVAPTLYPKLARSLIHEVSVHQAWHDFEELPDWPARNAEVGS